MSQLSVLYGRFEDVDDLVDTVRGWNLEFRQLDRGQLAASMIQVSNEQALVSWMKLDRCFDQRGTSPPGVRTFSIVEDDVSDFRWCGRNAHPDVVLTFRSGDEFEAASRPGFRGSAISIAESRLDDIASELGLPGFAELGQGRERAIACDPRLTRSLRAALACFRDAVLDSRLRGGEAGLREALDFELPAALLRALTSRVAGSCRPPSARSRDLALRRALEFIEAHPGQPLTVRQVCAAAQVSERTLQYAFLGHFGVPPKAYLKALRLNAARRELRMPGVRIVDVANRWGFWHMGQFAADYRRHFGERPSDKRTRQASV